MEADNASNGSKIGIWAGFLVMAFGVVGLVSAMGIYAAQIPLERLAARNETLTQFAAAPNDAAREALRDALADSADHVMGKDGHIAGSVAAPIAAERARLLTAFTTEARDEGGRLRASIAVFTVMGALFGVFALSLASRRES